MVVDWLRSNAIGLEHCSCIMSNPVNTETGDRLWAGKPSNYVTSHSVDSAFYPLWDGKLSVRFWAA